MPTPTNLALPRPSIHIDGSPHPSLTADLTSLIVEESISSPARCLARFLNIGNTRPERVDFKYFDLHDFDFGRLLTIWQGLPPATLFRIFEGRIHLIEGDYPAGAPPEVLVQAQDDLREFRTKQRTRVFEHLTDTDIIQAIAGEHGLNTDISLSGDLPVHGQLAQLNQSDGAFLFERVMAVGGEMWIDPGTLVVTDSAPPGVPQELEYGQNLAAFSVRADLSQQRTVIGVSGWSLQAKTVLAASASEADLPPEDLPGMSGGRIVEAAFGQALEALVDTVPETQAEAKSLATAFYRQRSADFVIGEGVAINAPGLRAGRRVDLRGLGALFSGTYQVTRVRHRFDLVNGQRTEFEARRARIARPGKTYRRKETADADRDLEGSRTPATRTRKRSGGPAGTGRAGQGDQRS